MADIPDLSWSFERSELPSPDGAAGGITTVGIITVGGLVEDET